MSTDSPNMDIESLSAASIDPSKIITDALAPVSEELQQLNQIIVELTGAQTHTSKEVVHHIFSGGGKRVRPALFFMSSNLVGYDGNHKINMAAVCEFVHTASLLHDDVIDNSPLRRNKPTANTLWGDESSVLTGDHIYAKASEMMADTGRLEIVSSFARAIRLMSEGELLQLEHLYNPDMPQDDYFKILENKTAVLLGAVCAAPAILNDSSEEQINALREFGRNVGFAFQLLDDALDYAGSTNIFGKKTLADLPEGKVTYPVLTLRQNMNPGDWASVAKIVRKSEISRNDMLAVLEKVNEFDTAGETLKLAEEYTFKALSSLNIFENSAAKENLIKLTKSLLLRLN